MDEVDRANQEVERSLAEALRKATKDIPPGKPGDCELCGEWSPRLVIGACPPCRDKYHLD